MTPNWHKWFSLFTAFVHLLDAILQWLHDWGDE